MPISREVSVGTTNKTLDLEIEANFEITVPESLEEAIDFFGGEEKLLDAIQSDVQTRKINAARPALRDAEQEQDWDQLAFQVAEQYQPGRRGGFKAVEVSGEDLESMTPAEIQAMLVAKGVRVT